MVFPLAPVLGAKNIVASPESIGAVAIVAGTRLGGGGAEGTRGGGGGVIEGRCDSGFIKPIGKKYNSWIDPEFPIPFRGYQNHLKMRFGKAKTAIGSVNLMISPDRYNKSHRFDFNNYLN